MPKIIISTTDGSTLEFELTADRARFGRAGDNDFVITDGSVSSYHGEFLSKGDSVEVHDLGSTNGTIVNGARVDQALIGPGESFLLGSCQAVVAGDAAEERAPNISSASVEASASRGTAAPAPKTSSPAPTAGVLSGVGGTPCPTQLRRGFGPKKKAKPEGVALILVGVIALLACAAAYFMIAGMGA